MDFPEHASTFHQSASILIELKRFPQLRMPQHSNHMGGRPERERERHVDVWRSTTVATEIFPRHRNAQLCIAHTNEMEPT